MRYRPPTIVLVLLAAVFFFVPALAWLTGERAKPIENRALVAFPSLDRGWDIFPALTQWTTDYLPLRSNAVRFNTRLSENIFGEAPGQVAAAGPVGVGQAANLAGQTKRKSGEPAPVSPVVKGDHGWLYLTQDFTSACKPAWSIPTVLRGLRRLDSIISASGRRLIVVVPPDKSTIERAEIPHDYALRKCAERAHRARIAAIRRLGLPGFVDMQAILEAQRRKQGSPIYLPLDSHWTQMGSYLFGRGIAEAIDPRLLSQSRVAPGAVQKVNGDLTTLIGDPKLVTQPGLVVQRTGVSAPRATQFTLYPGALVGRERRTSTPGGAELYKPRAVIHGSSFTRVSADKLRPYFADITLAPQLLDAEDAGHLPRAERYLIETVKRSKLLILEQVEREFWGVEAGSLLRPEFLDRLERALGSR
jgi:alginate O-acetyltransferase complex protein AlgJ